MRVHHKLMILFTAKATLFTALILVGSISAAADHDWPRWRGEKGDASSSESGLLKAWPAEGPGFQESAALGAAAVSCGPC